MKKFKNPKALALIFVVSSLILTSCFTKVSTSNSEFRAPPYPPMPDRIFQLAPENSDRIILGIEREKYMIDIARRLEWEGFSVCHINEEAQTLAVQQRFMNERFTLQINLIKSGDILEGIIIWRDQAFGTHFITNRKSNQQRWNKAYRDRNLSSKNAKAFAIGTFHLLHIPHHSLTFESGYQLNVGTAGFCR